LWSGVAGEADIWLASSDVWPPALGVDKTDEPWRAYANEPARSAASGQLVSELRDYLRERVPDYLVPSAFVPMPDGLPVTSNGKLDRSALPAPDGARVDTPYAPPADPVQQRLAEIWSDVLGVERVGIHDRFFELGGDSILSIQVVARAGQRGLRLVPRDLFRHQTIAELAAAVGGAPDDAGVDDEAAGEIPPPPAQDWFDRLNLVAPNHFNQAMLLAVRGEPLRPELLEQAVREGAGRHDAFRLRYRSGGRELVDEPGIEVTVHKAGEEAMAILADRANAGLDVAAGPLAHAVLVVGDQGCEQLLLAVHHLAVDGVSWWTLVEDITAAYRRLSGHATDSDDRTTASYVRYARAIARRAEEPELLAQLPAWRELLAEPVPALPRDVPGTGGGTEADAYTATRTLSLEETEKLLVDAGTAYRTHTDELLLAGFAAALDQWAGVRRLRVDLEGHGREAVDLDLSRTVGWFTTFTPVVLDLPGMDLDQLIPAVKDQRRAVPGDPAAYGILRGRADRPLDDQPVAEIGFNYLGRTDRIGGDLFAPVRGGGGQWRAATNPRPYLLEVNCQVTGGRFELAVTSARTVHRAERIDALAEAFAAGLRAVIDHCMSADAGAYTPSDFPLAGLDRGQLAAALGQFRQARSADRPGDIDD
jgi:non-ribosomal peptide synthase protein (TIGR01720 family)